MFDYGARSDRDRTDVRASCDCRQWRRLRGAGAGPGGAGEAMIPLPSGVRVWLATGHTDMRKGFPGLSLQVQEVLRRDPLSGHLFVFRGRRGQQATFCIWFSNGADCLSLASVGWSDPSGRAAPAWEGSTVHLHRRAARSQSRTADLDVRRGVLRRNGPGPPSDQHQWPEGTRGGSCSAR